MQQDWKLQNTYKRKRESKREKCTDDKIVYYSFGKKGKAKLCKGQTRSK